MSAPRRSPVLVLLLVLAAGACTRGASADLSRPAPVASNYVYAGHGSTFTIPWDFTARLDFEKSGEYTLTFDAVVKGDPEHDIDRGTFEVRGDSLLLRSHGGDGEQHTLLIRGDSLVAGLGWRGRMALKVVGVPDPVFLRADR